MIQITQKDAYELGVVLKAMVNNKSAELEFTDIIHLHKMSGTLSGLSSEFGKKLEEADKEKNELVTIANKKITDYKKEILKKSRCDWF